MGELFTCTSKWDAHNYMEVFQWRMLQEFVQYAVVRLVQLSSKHRKITPSFWDAFSKTLGGLNNLWLVELPK
jgi:hypothetical protein